MAQGSVNKNNSNIQFIEKPIADLEKKMAKEVETLDKLQIESIIEEKLLVAIDELEKAKTAENQYANNLAIKAAYRAEKRRDMNLTYAQFLDQLKTDLESL